MSPTISIIMPVFHAEKYIQSNLSKLLSHNLTNVQLIIVVCEDGYDQTATLCTQFLKDAENTQVIIQPEQGLSVARNTGLMEATGKYVLFMDSDDILLKPGFSLLIEKLEHSSSDVIVCKYVLMQQNGYEKWPNYTFPTIKSTEEAKIAIYSTLPDSIWNVWRYICRKSFLQDNNLYFIPGLLGEDVEWTPRMLEHAKSITFFDTPIYGYFYNHTQQLSRQVNPNKTIHINKTVANSITVYKDKPYGIPLCHRLIRESLYSISDYCRFNASERKTIRPIINTCEKYYNLSPDSKVKLYIKTRTFIPLYLWSAALLLAKIVRGKLKNFLGANKVWRAQ